MGVGRPAGAGVAVVRFGDRLRRLRLRRGKSAAVIAGLAGMSQPHLSMMENGVRSAYRLPVLARLAWALDVSPRELVLAALEDYLVHGDVEPTGEGDNADARGEPTGRCRACPVALPGGVTCMGECG